MHSAVTLDCVFGCPIDVGADTMKHYGECEPLHFAMSFALGVDLSCQATRFGLLPANLLVAALAFKMYSTISNRASEISEREFSVIDVAVAALTGLRLK